MEPYEKLKSLPDSEKVKYFEDLLEYIRHATDDSGDPGKSTNKKFSLATFLNIATEHGASSGGSVKKKQKTLDSWLIKPKDTSPSTTKAGESSKSSKESTNQKLNLVVNNVTECLGSIQPTLKNVNVSSSGNNENSLENTKRPDRTDNSEQNIYITGAVTERYKLRSNRRNTEPSSQLSKSKSCIKSSVFTDDIDFHKSNRELIQSGTVNNCDVNYDIYPEDITSYHSNLVDNNDGQKFNNSSTKVARKPRSRKKKINAQDLVQSTTKPLIQLNTTNDCEVNQDITPEDLNSNHSNLVKSDGQELNDLNSCNKAKRNLRPRKRKLNAQDLVQSTPKSSNITVNKDVNMEEITESLETNNNIDSSSLSNWEAFHILEQQCARFNLNIVDILQDENIQAVLNDPEKLDYETVLFFKAFKSNNGEILPVVHVVDSITELCNTVEEIKKSQQ